MSSFYSEDTIAAITTPMGSGGIGIIRISGPEAFAIAKKLFRASLSLSKEASSEIFDKLSSHSLRHGYTVNPDTEEVLDECLFGKMCGPSTYTCEDVVEINCHGGMAVMKSILGILFSLGVRPAGPGEFTKRAFLNGRLDLSEAEGVMDIINAETEKSRKAAVEQLDGRFSAQLKSMRQKLTESIGEIEVALEYPEYEMDVPAFNNTEKALEEIIAQLKELSLSYGRGRLLREGLKVVIAGKPNAGKSSLLNFLTGHNRAIVTDIPGTTRDTIEEFTEIDGYPVIFTDTAGLRESSDIVEQIGVDKAKQEIKEADLVLYVVDPKDESYEKVDFTKGYVIINKTDSASEEEIQRCETFYNEKPVIKISVLEKQGVNAIFEVIKETFDFGENTQGKMLITNARHKQLIDQASEALQRGIDQYKMGMPLDMITYDMWQSAGFLGEIVGESVSEEIIDSIFDRFCLGK